MKNFGDVFQLSQGGRFSTVVLRLFYVTSPVKRALRRSAVSLIKIMEV